MQKSETRAIRMASELGKLPTGQKPNKQFGKKLGKQLIAGYLCMLLNDSGAFRLAAPKIN